MFCFARPSAVQDPKKNLCSHERRCAGSLLVGSITPTVRTEAVSGASRVPHPPNNLRQNPLDLSASSSERNLSASSRASRRSSRSRSSSALK
jgi:hypothetical protein